MHARTLLTMSFRIRSPPQVHNGIITNYTALKEFLVRPVAALTAL